MKLTTFSKICLFCVLIAFRFQITAADDSSVPPLNPSDATFGSDADRGRLICALLEAIEQNHLEPPSRRELIRIVTRALTGIADEKRGDALHAEFLRTLDAEFLSSETASQLNLVIDQLDSPVVSFDRFAQNVMENFNQVFGKDRGEIRLIRSKDHDVEEQFRGNRYVGLGVALRPDPENRLPVVFAAIIPGGPAERGGLPTGTVVHEIDGKATRGLPLQTIVDCIRGREGTDVTLKISVPNSAEEKTVTLTRGVVRFDSLKNREHRSLSDENLLFDQTLPIGWINVTDISSSTLHEFRSAEALSRANRIRVLVLDFRHSIRSGDLHQGLLVADSFLDGGEIWKQTERHMEPRIELADPESLFRGIPLVILVDQRTGPVHCAIAAALQYAMRAKIVGETPQFQGWISKTVRLQDVPFSLEMRTSRLMRTRENLGWPLEPDVPVSVTVEPDTAEALTKLNAELLALSRKVIREQRKTPSSAEAVQKLLDETTALSHKIQAEQRAAEQRAFDRSTPGRSEITDAAGILVAREFLHSLTVDQK